MFNKKMFAIATIIGFLPLLLSALMYSSLPDTVATHWNANGVADGYSSKFVGVIILPLILALSNLIMPFAIKSDPRNKEMNEKVINVIMWILPITNIMCTGVTIGQAMGLTVRIEIIIPFILGIMFIVIGNYLPKTKQSYTIGIKAPWTLESEENWEKTHRLAGFLWVLCGLMICVSCFIKWRLIVFIISLIIMTIVPMAYSYIIYKKGNR